MGSSSRSRRNQGAAAEADAIGKQNGVETDAIESSSYRAAISLGAAAEADAIGGGGGGGGGGGQLCTESWPAPDYSRRRTRGK